MIPGYKITQEIYRGRKRVVYRGLRGSDGLAVVIKTFAAELPDEKDVAGLRREFEMLRSLDSAGIPKVYGLERFDGRPALILEDIGGKTLRSLIDTGKIDLLAFLKIGIKLSETVADIHRSGVIHRDIAPKNIVVNLLTEQVRLIDFSISSRPGYENPRISHPGAVEGTLAYISPEGTGRMNRAVDHRADFYSLGVSFYEMLIGRLPFISTDPMETVYFHIAKVPPSPRNINPGIPQAVSDIVMKLLSKAPEDRYKSAYGLKSDLEECLARRRGGGKIEWFAPGQNDFSETFQISRKLYGREKEIEALMEAFGRVGDGAAEMMLVSGYSGVGKSALVNEVHKPIARGGGILYPGNSTSLNATFHTVPS